MKPFLFVQKPKLCKKFNDITKIIQIETSIDLRNTSSHQQ